MNRFIAIPPNATTLSLMITMFPNCSESAIELQMRKSNKPAGDWVQVIAGAVTGPDSDAPMFWCAVAIKDLGARHGDSIEIDIDRDDVINSVAEWKTWRVPD